MANYPKISIITTSLNQGAYIESAILSVLGQGYPNLEYIIIDGGSEDGTVDILKKYDNQITYWQSKEDGGESDAANQGFNRATGDILSWMASDDMYMPGVFQKVVQLLDPLQKQILCGNVLHFVEETGSAWGSKVPEAFNKLDLRYSNFIIQPGTFWTRKTWETLAGFDTSLHYAMDWDFWLRAKKNEVQFIPTSEYLSIYRLHSQHKSTQTGGESRIKEISALIGKNLTPKHGAFYHAWNTRSSRNGTIRKLFEKIKMGRLYFLLLRILWFRTAGNLSTEDIRKLVG